MVQQKDWLNLVLHAHLPFIHHPEQKAMLEESWLFEAMLECYLPLIRLFDRLSGDDIPCRLTLSLSPTLISMLQNPGLQRRFQQRLLQLMELARSEVSRTQRSADFYPLACMYQRMLDEISETYYNYGGNLIRAFAHHRDAGRLEIITTSATHAFLPLLSHHPAAVMAQLKTGVAVFEKAFDQTPSGLWLPECGYYPGLESALSKLAINYCFIENHGIYDALPHQKNRDVYQPVENNQVAFFGRDPESSEQVWSSKVGYPANPDYREYYRDIGMEFPQEDIAPYLIDGETRSPTGFKYYRITGHSEDKKPYHRSDATRRAQQHAANFIECKRYQFQRIKSQSRNGGPLIITAPFDAELFGHWWFEGPVWLEQVIRLAAHPASDVALASASDYLARSGTLEHATPAASSWGAGGYNQYWLNTNNEWIYPLLNDACQRMEQLANDFADIDSTEHPLTIRLLQQAARTLMLAQSSDWPFIMQSGSSPDYARNRLLDHLARFNFLDECLRSGAVDEEKLHAIETMDHIFPDIDFRLYQTRYETTD